jgi:hypothetical protein
MIAALIGTLNCITLGRAKRSPALWCLAIRALIKLSIGITELNGNVTEFLTEVANGLQNDH